MMNPVFSIFSILVLAAALATRPCAAALGHKVTLPIGPKAPSGLTLTIHDRGIDANGYRPIEIEVVPRPATKPIVADRQIRVVLEFNRYGFQTTNQVSQVIELPEG